MTFKSLGDIDFPDAQVHGLEIAYKVAVNAGYKASNGQPPASPEEYLADIVVRKMQDLEVEQVSGVVLDRIFQAEKLGFEQNDTTRINQTAAIWGVSTVVDVPPDKEAAIK